MLRRPRRHDLATGALICTLLGLGACSAGPEPSPSASPEVSTTPSATPAPASAQFNLFLVEPAAHTAAFRVAVQPDPAAGTETEHTFCASGSTQERPCDPSPYAYTIRLDDLPPGTTVSYRFERVDTDGSVEVLDQGSAPVDRALIREVTYPEPVATGCRSRSCEIQPGPGLVGLA